LREGSSWLLGGFGFLFSFIRFHLLLDLWILPFSVLVLSSLLRLILVISIRRYHHIILQTSKFVHLNLSCSIRLIHYPRWRCMELDLRPRIRRRIIIRISKRTTGVSIRISSLAHWKAKSQNRHIPLHGLGLVWLRNWTAISIRSGRRTEREDPSCLKPICLLVVVKWWFCSLDAVSLRYRGCDGHGSGEVRSVQIAAWNYTRCVALVKGFGVGAAGCVEAFSFS